MKKSERLDAFVSSLGAEPSLSLHPCYQGYFTCFNSQQYYEAHDVLEHLWLQGCGDDHSFYKGLIQLAGAFVHLQKQYLRPEHPKDGKRLRPAVRLFTLALANLVPYAPRHLELELGAVEALCRGYMEEIGRSDFLVNPWRPESAPRLAPTTAS